MYLYPVCSLYTCIYTVWTWSCKYVTVLLFIINLFNNTTRPCCILVWLGNMLSWLLIRSNNLCLRFSQDLWSHIAKGGCNLWFLRLHWEWFHTGSGNWLCRMWEILPCFQKMASVSTVLCAFICLNSVRPVAMFFHNNCWFPSFILLLYAYRITNFKIFQWDCCFIIETFAFLVIRSDLILNYFDIWCVGAVILIYGWDDRS